MEFQYKKDLCGNLTLETLKEQEIPNYDSHNSFNLATVGWSLRYSLWDYYVSVFSYSFKKI